MVLCSSETRNPSPLSGTVELEKNDQLEKDQHQWTFAG